MNDHCDTLTPLLNFQFNFQTNKTQVKYLKSERNKISQDESEVRKIVIHDVIFFLFFFNHVCVYVIIERIFRKEKF